MIESERNQVPVVFSQFKSVVKNNAGFQLVKIVWNTVRNLYTEINMPYLQKTVIFKLRHGPLTSEDVELIFSVFRHINFN